MTDNNGYETNDGYATNNGYATNDGYATQAEEELETYDIYNFLGKSIPNTRELNNFKNFTELTKAYLEKSKNYDSLRASYSGKVAGLSDDDKNVLAKELGSTIYGVPEKSDGYNIESGLEIGDEITKATYEGKLKEAAHMVGVSANKIEEFKEVFEGYAVGLQQQFMEQAEKVVLEDLKCSRDVYGNELSGMIDVIDNFFDTVLPGTRLGKDGADNLKLAIYNSGLAANPYMLAFLEDYAKMFKAHPMRSAPSSGRNYRQGSGNGTMSMIRRG